MLIARKFVKETRFSCGAQMAHFATSEGASTSFQDFSLGNRETCATTRNYSEWNEHMLIIITNTVQVFAKFHYEISSF